jgi:hypothetical protein
MTTGSWTDIDACRVCRSTDLATVLELGNHPLANALEKPGDGEADRYPLTLLFCPACSTVQLRETVAKERLFRHYVWVTGTAATTQEYAKRFCNRASEVAGLKAGDFVVELASNDGTFLRPFLEQNCRIVGVDPARNIAAIARERGIPTEAEFWDEEIAGRLLREHGPARFVFGRNVIAHASELHSVVRGMAGVLGDDGVGALEFHSAAAILEGLQYDSIYHEHLCYFSLLSVRELLRISGLHPFHVEHSPISGGALVVYFARQQRQETEAYQQCLAAENRMGLGRLDSWLNFARRCLEHRDACLKLLDRLDHGPVVGFGASARSSTFLNFCGIRHPQIDRIIDNNPLKHNTLSPGTGIPIVSCAEGLARKPGLIFILAWNFLAEIQNLCAQQGYSGSYLVAFPERLQLVNRGQPQTTPSAP